MKEERKFKVGDRVYEKETLDKGIIINIDDDEVPYLVKFDDYEKCWMFECDLELVQPKQFAKEDLKVGDKLFFRNEQQVSPSIIKKITNGTIYFQDCWEFELSLITDDLRYIPNKSYDIVKVERQTKTEIVFEREEPKEVEKPKQIEKLVFTGDGNADYTSTIPKINELIDKINELEKRLDNE